MSCVTQMHHARQGALTPEMRRVAEREELAPSWFARRSRAGGLINPANVGHLAKRLDPMAIGKSPRSRSTPTSATQPSRAISMGSSTSCITPYTTALTR